VQRQLVQHRLLEQPEPEVQVHLRQLAGQERQQEQLAQPVHLQHIQQDRSQLQLERHTLTHIHHMTELARSCGMLVLHDSYGTVLVRSCDMLVLARSNDGGQEHKPRHGNASACDTCSYVRLLHCCSPAASPLRPSSIQFDSSYASF
jgi:hypothetical protein